MKITCEAHNQAEFRAELAKHADLRTFAAALYKLGMIEGLKGAEIYVGESVPPLGGVTLGEMVIETRKDSNAWSKR